MRTWMGLSVFALTLATGAAALAADESATEPPAARPGVEEVVAKAKRLPPAEPASVGAIDVEIEAAVSAAPIEIANPAPRLVRGGAREAGKGETSDSE